MHVHIRPPPRELFFAPLQIALNPTEYESVQFAYQCSKYGHAKQIRDDGTRYFDHPKAAAWIYINELKGRKPRIINALLLHDMSEDQYLLSPWRLAQNFGPETALDISALTKLPKGKETTEEYLRRVIVQGMDATLAKLIDRLHNLRDVHDATKHKRQVDETKQYHIPMLIHGLKDCGIPWYTYATYIEEEILKACKSI